MATQDEDNTGDASRAEWVRWLEDKVPNNRVGSIVVVVAGLLLFMPFLGTLGLWDPWETHYGEVARSMIVRDDYVYPYWESSYFFSKPALPMWLMALGLLVVGAENPELPDAALGAWAEWGMRVPFALIAILCMWSVYRIGTQLKDQKTGLFAALVCGSSPQFIFIGKQAMVDMPFVGFMTAGLALFVAAVFDREEDSAASTKLRVLAAVGVAVSSFPQLILIGRETASAWPAIAGGAVVAVAAIAYLIVRSTRQQCWLAGFYVYMALAALSKGLAPLAIVGPVVVVYALMTADFDVIRRARVLAGAVLFLLVGTPWYLAVSLFDGRDDEGKTFVQRFWMHDNFGRVGSGVHGDRGGLAYFLEQIAYGMFPWVALLPSAIGFAARQPDEDQDQHRRRAVWFVLLWALWSYVFFSVSLTKFHHYIFPALPAFAVLVGYWLSWVVEAPRQRLGNFAAVSIAVVFVVAARDLLTEPQNLVNLFTYKYDRDYPREVQPRLYMNVIIWGGAAITMWFWSPRGLVRVAFAPLVILSAFFSGLAEKAWNAVEPRLPQAARGRAILAFLGLGAVMGAWISHHHFNMLTPHWSQAHLFKTFEQERKPNEPIYAYQLNWRGETFYSRNRVLQVKENGANERMRQLVDRPGREFIITEQSRYHTLQGILSPDKRDKIRILDRSNNKFYLCIVDE